jgi:Flp pilus assembly protein TadD
VTVILFRNQKEFKEYTVSEAAAAYYTTDGTRDFIVMSDANNKETAVHEYMHLLTRRLDLDLRAWLNEGIAEVYSTLKPHAGRILLGEVPLGHRLALAGGGWLKLPHLLSVTRDSPEYNEKNRAGLFYAQSWLLTHMLSLDPRYRDRFGSFLGMVSEGTKSEEALWKTYAKSTAEIERELHYYHQASLLTGILFNAQFEKLQVGEVRKADPFEVELALALLAGLIDRQDEARQRLGRLASENPNRWEPLVALARLALRKQDMESARAHLRKVMPLQPNDWRVYWDYARIESGSDEHAPIITAMRRIVELNPSHVDAALMLAERLHHNKQYGESLVAYRSIKSVNAARAPRLFIGKAHTHLRLEQFNEARTAAQEALKYAKDARDKESAANILSFLTSHQTRGV